MILYAQHQRAQRPICALRPGTCTTTEGNADVVIQVMAHLAVTEKDPIAQGYLFSTTVAGAHFLFALASCTALRC